MGRKIKFALKSTEGKNITTLEELRIYGDLKCVVEVFYTKKLMRWLEDRNCVEELNLLANIDIDDKNFLEELVATLGLENVDMNLDVDTIIKALESTECLDEVEETRATLEPTLDESKIDLYELELLGFDVKTVDRTVHDLEQVYSDENIKANIEFLSGYFDLSYDEIVTDDIERDRYYINALEILKLRILNEKKVLNEFCKFVRQFNPDNEESKRMVPDAVPIGMNCAYFYFESEHVAFYLTVCDVMNIKYERASDGKQYCTNRIEFETNPY